MYDNLNTDLELQNKIIPDVGAGNGGSSVLLLNGKENIVTSLDHDLKMLKKGLKRETILKRHAVLADARHLPFNDSLDMFFPDISCIVFGSCEILARNEASHQA